jgi:hypothetical protein
MLRYLLLENSAASDAPKQEKTSAVSATLQFRYTSRQPSADGLGCPESDRISVTVESPVSANTPRPFQTVFHKSSGELAEVKIMIAEAK